jgi:hypothetical protein
MSYPIYRMRRADIKQGKAYIYPFLNEKNRAKAIRKKYINRANAIRPYGDKIYK